MSPLEVRRYVSRILQHEDEEYGRPHREVRYGSCLVMMLFALGLSSIGVASAQWDPGATQQLGMGYGQNAMSQSALRNTEADLADSDKPSRGYAGSGLSRRERLLALEDEYLQRLERDGADSAKAWAFEMGRRDARVR